MGWVRESDTHLHEAALVPFFEDGSVSHGSTMVDGVDYEVVEIGGRPDGDRRRPSAEIVGWLLRCDCRRWESSDPYSSELSSWTDPVQWARVPSASLEDLARHRVFAPDSDVHADERPEVAEAARAVWQREHLDPIDVDGEIRAAADARRDADARLDAAVAKARRLGRSWADIGAAAGMTRQSANERWKDRV
ncbi:MULTISPECIES: hypothetical protein [Gordonia]|uniref:hypothetical protein n=1 Tax=Gordonia TaxID=2053 RepID=UPI0019656249|nr:MULTISPECIES: hypothetical protein [unclassified Gordonia (in: high G+C Gram-positive bacteria)]MBN0975100.1 hypothetical protein [Gordonia sp. BP-119]MBN0985273.1 hypothetical protein [Gordonia sp. BP-94]